MRRRTCLYLGVAAHWSIHPLAVCALAQDSTFGGQLRLVSMVFVRRLNRLPFCFTLSNDTTKSDREPGNAEEALDLGCIC